MWPRRNYCTFSFCLVICIEDNGHCFITYRSPCLTLYVSGWPGGGGGRVYIPNNTNTLERLTTVAGYLKSKDILQFDFARNTRRWLNVVLMLARRLRRRPNIKTTLGQRLVFAGFATQNFPDKFKKH